MPELTCKELVELVTDYLEGALSATDHARFERHIAGCDGCTAYLEEMRETITLIGDLHESGVSPAAAERLLKAFHNWKRGG
jgi:anti-sigma factor RsiW